MTDRPPTVLERSTDTDLPTRPLGENETAMLAEVEAGAAAESFLNVAAHLAHQAGAPDNRGSMAMWIAEKRDAGRRRGRDAAYAVFVGAQERNEDD